MRTTVKRKIPKITLVGLDKLGSNELFILNHIYKMDRSEFVLVQCKREEIYLNEKMPQLVPLIEKIMAEKWLMKTSRHFDRFKEIAGDKAEGALLRIWSDWKKERKEADLRADAEKILKTARKECLVKYIKPNKELVRMLFDMGFGLYDEGTKCDWQKGAENAFLYGCLYAVNNGLTGTNGLIVERR